LVDAPTKIDQEVDRRYQALKSQCELAERRRSEEHRQQMASLEALVHTLQKAIPERFLALERQALELAYEALCRICGPLDVQGPAGDRGGMLADLLRQGLTQLRGHLALQRSEQARALLTPLVHVTEDNTLLPLSIVVETDHGHLDISLSTQLERLKELWLSASELRGADVGPLGGV